jgi:methylsterol monooxygenase
LLDFAIYNVLEDFLFYWTHRLFHIPYFYKRFHYIHHTYEAPYSLVGTSCSVPLARCLRTPIDGFVMCIRVGGIAHPVEFVLNFMLPFLAGPFLCASLWGTHILTYCAWQLFREMRSTEAHSGYLLPWHMSHFLKFIGYMGAPMHDVHHRRKGMKTNFGSYVFWDLICGTYATSDNFEKKN